MRSLLFLNKEKVTDVSSTVTTRTLVSKPSTTEAQTAQGTVSGKAVREQKTVVLRKRNSHRKRIAACSLAISLAIGARWYYANRAPTYPLGEGVLPSAGQYVEKHPTPANAAYFYMAASEALPSNLGKGWYRREWREISLAEQKESVLQYGKSIALVRQGVQHPYYGGYQTKLITSVKDWGEDMQFPDYQYQISIMRVLGTDAHLKQLSGDASGAMSAALDVIQFGIDIGSDMGQECPLMAGMTGILGQLIGQNVALPVVSSLSAANARTYTARLETMLPRAPTFAQIMTGERDHVYNESQRRFGNAPEMVRLYNTQRYIINAYQESGLVPSGLRGWIHKTGQNLIYDGLIFAYTRQGLVNDYAALIDRVIIRGKMSYQKSKYLGPVHASSNPWITSIAETSLRPLRECTEVEARNQILLGRLAVQAYRKEHQGMLPPSLESLMEGPNPYLKSIPYDSFSPEGNAPLHLDKKTGLVYSVGENGIDDHFTGDDADLQK